MRLLTVNKRKTSIKTLKLRDVFFSSLLNSYGSQGLANRSKSLYIFFIFVSKRYGDIMS